MNDHNKTIIYSIFRFFVVYIYIKLILLIIINFYRSLIENYAQNKANS